MSSVRPFLYLIVAAMFCLAAGAQAAVTKSAIDAGRYHALVIGNNDYKHLPNLKTAVSDATAMAELLRTKYRFKVTLLLNATRRQVLKQINRLRAELTSKDRLLIYHAGHGELDRETETGYWLPVDAEPEDDTNWIANDRLSRHLRAMSAHHVMVVADSCYSGALVRAANAAPKTGSERDEWLQRMAKKRSRTAVVSGGLEPVADGGAGGHSVFANAFLKALRENGAIPDGQKLFQQVRSEVVLNADQTPQYSNIRRASHEGGDFLFIPAIIVVPKKALAAPTIDKSALELAYWNAVKDSDDPVLLGTYVKKYPTGEFVDLARAMIAAGQRALSRQNQAQATQRVSNAWNAVRDSGSISALRAYLTQYPDSPNGFLARARINDLEAAGQLKARQADQLRETNAWQAASDANSAPALQAYLQQYPTA